MVDNGPEFAGQVMVAWAYRRGITLRFIDPGKPIQNAYIESFNGKFRDECLNQHWFVSLEDARRIIAAWRDDYNQHRPQVRSVNAHLRPLPSSAPERVFLLPRLAESVVLTSLS